MATIPIYNPQSPFLGLMPSGFNIGWTLKIRAQIQGFSNRCQIYIQSGPALSPRDDVMLHISIRPQENSIVRTHMANQIMGAEERHGGNPIQAHQSFEIAITPESSHYRIEINGQHFATFAHRLPMHQAKFVSIGGTCTISHITLDHFGSAMPMPINPPIHVHVTPRYPIHHHPPPPPPMPHAPPPPYPGHYPGHHPGHHHPTPFTTVEEKDNKKTVKIAAAVGAGVGLTAVALGRASRNLRKKH